MQKYLVATLLLCSPLMLPSSAKEGGDVVRSRCREGDNWYFYNGKCYFWSGHTEGWFGAEKHCHDMGGHLVNIGSRSDNNFLNGLAQCVNNFWIGMVKTDVRQRGFVWWDTKKPSNYTEMMIPRAGDYLDCMYFDAYDHGRWSNAYCQQTRNYVCTTPASSNDGLAKSDPPADSQENVKCPSDWLSLENNCYFVSSEKANYFNAQLSCEAKGATVASVVSQREQTLVTVALGCAAWTWIGLEKAKPCYTNPSQQTCWVWLDGSPFTFTAWQDGSPSTAKEVECAVTNGRWSTANCYNEYRYICKKKK